MACVACGSAAVTERPERTARGYRRFRCRDCGRQFNERSGGLLNHTHSPSDVIALVVLWRLRYRLTLRDLAEMFLVRGLVFSHEAVREWEAKLAPVLADELRRRRHGRGGAGGRHWHVDETYIKVRGRWAYLYRAIDRDGNLVDTMLSEHRDMAAAQAFFRSAKAATGIVPDRPPPPPRHPPPPHPPPPPPRRNQHAPADRRRLLHRRRANAALAILEAA